LKELFDRFKVIVTENSCFIYDSKYYRTLINQFNTPEHMISTNTKGNRYYLYFRRDEFDKNMCIFIDRKICHGYTQPRIIYTNFRMDSEIFDGTLVHGELVKMPNGRWSFMMNDILAYCGKQLKHKDKIERITSIYTLLKTQYTSDSILDVCELQVKRFFTYKELPKMLQKISELPYQVNGLLFNALKAGRPDILLLHNFSTTFVHKQLQKPHHQTQKTPVQTQTHTHTQARAQAHTQSHKDTKNNIELPVKRETIDLKSPTTFTSHSNLNANANINTNMNVVMFTFMLSKIEGGIFQLVSLVNKNEKIYGLARIDKMKTQRMVEKALKTSTLDEKVLMDCKYSVKFRKFIPVCVSAKTCPDQYLDVTQYVKTLT